MTDVSTYCLVISACNHDNPISRNRLAERHQSTTVDAKSSVYYLTNCPPQSACYSVPMSYSLARAGTQLGKASAVVATRCPKGAAKAMMGSGDSRCPPPCANCLTRTSRSMNWRLTAPYTTAAANTTTAWAMKTLRASACLLQQKLQCPPCR